MIFIRLWHQNLISYLPRQQLLGQHRECCGMRGKGWGQNHSTVNYVWEYSIERLIAFHLLVMKEMEDRGFNVTQKWFDKQYRGKKLAYDESIDKVKVNKFSNKKPIYPEHDDEYLEECFNNLAQKGVDIKKNGLSK